MPAEPSNGGLDSHRREPSRARPSPPTRLPPSFSTATCRLAPAWHDPPLRSAHARTLLTSLPERYPITFPRIESRRCLAMLQYVPEFVLVQVFRMFLRRCFC